MNPTPSCCTERRCFGARCLACGHTTKLPWPVNSSAPSSFRSHGSEQLFATQRKTIYAGLVNAEHLQSDVIGTASLFGDLDEGATGGGWRLRSKRFFDLISPHLSP